MPHQLGAPPGWYPDSIAGRLRWWDGAAWTADSVPAVEREDVGSLRRVVGRLTSLADRDRSVVHQAAPTSDPPREHRNGLFLGRRETEAELERLQGQLDALGFTERIALQTQLRELRTELADLVAERDALWSQVQPLRAEIVGQGGRPEVAEGLPGRTEGSPAAEVPLAAEADPSPTTVDRCTPRIELAELERHIIEAG